MTVPVDATHELCCRLTRGDTVYAVRRKVSRSNLSELVQFYRITKQYTMPSAPAKPVAIGREIASTLGLRFNQEMDGVSIRTPERAEGVVARLSGRLFYIPDGLTLEWL